MAHRLTTQYTTAEIEARDTAEEPLEFAIDPIECYGRYTTDESVILTSADGDSFLAHVVDTDYDRLRIYVEVD